MKAPKPSRSNPMRPPRVGCSDLLGGMVSSICLLCRQRLQKLVEIIHRNAVRLRRRIRRTKKQLILKTRYLRLLRENLALKAKVLFLECRIAHLRLAKFLVAHGLNEWWPRVLPPNDPSSATRPTRAHDCNLGVMAGFAAAHG